MIEWMHAHWVMISVSSIASAFALELYQGFQMRKAEERAEMYKNAYARTLLAGLVAIDEALELSRAHVFDGDESKLTPESLVRVVPPQGYGTRAFWTERRSVMESTLGDKYTVTHYAKAPEVRP